MLFTSDRSFSEDGVNIK